MDKSPPTYENIFEIVLEDSLVERSGKITEYEFPHEPIPLLLFRSHPPDRVLTLSGLGVGGCEVVLFSEVRKLDYSTIGLDSAIHPGVELSFREILLFIDLTPPP